MLDNYEAIKKTTFPRYPETDPSVFYMFEVIQRKKDGHDECRAVEITYGDFYDERFMDRLRFLTETFHARTYMKINRCYEAPIAMRTMARMAEMISNGQYNVRNCYDSICGSYKPKDDVRWLLDIDADELPFGTCLDFTAVYEAQAQANRDPMTALINTPNGFHLITRPFDPRPFNFGHALKKNASTVLFSWKDQDTSKLPQITLPSD